MLSRMLSLDSLRPEWPMKFQFQPKISPTLMKNADVAKYLIRDGKL